MPWLHVAILAGAKMNDETTEPEPTIPSESGASAQVERLARGRRRDRRGKGQRDQAGSAPETVASSTVVSENARPEQQQSVTAVNSPPRSPEFRRHRGQQGFGDGVDRQLCAFCVPALPETYPVQGRPGIAVAAYRVIAEMEGSQLLCNQLHAGECAWADLTPLDPAEAVSRNWSVVTISGPEVVNSPEDHSQLANPSLE